MDDLRSAPVPPPAADDHLRGARGARLVIVYGDFTCPRCALAAARMRDLPLRIVFRHFALPTKHPRAVALALAAEAAGLQGRFWEMHDALFADQGHVDDPHLWERAEQMGLDIDRFEVDRRAGGPAEKVARQLRDGMRAGVALTPTLFVDGVAHGGPPDADLVRELTADAGRSSSMVGFG